MALIAVASHAWRVCVRWVSGELLLRGAQRRANSGAVILFRSLLITANLYIPALAIWEYTAPGAYLAFDWPAFKAAVHHTLPWAGAIFGAVYALLYSKFASQWTYLASLYNQIKAMEASVACSGRASEAQAIVVSAKAGFIEDADELHLAAKPMYAAVIRAWGKDPEVEAEFAAFAPGGRRRLTDIMTVVNFMWDSEEARFAKLILPAATPPSPTRR